MMLPARAARCYRRRLLPSPRWPPSVRRWGAADVSANLCAGFDSHPHRRWSAGGLPGLRGRPAAIALGIELQDRRVVHEAVDRGDCHCLVEENSLPGAEGLIAGDNEASALVA